MGGDISFLFGDNAISISTSWFRHRVSKSLRASNSWIILCYFFFNKKFAFDFQFAADQH